VIADTVNGVLKLHQLYRLADPGCTSRVTVPVLWDKKEGTIVSNNLSFGGAARSIGECEAF
jgi:putative glutathione S-transferase